MVRRLVSKSEQFSTEKSTQTVQKALQQSGIFSDASDELLFALVDLIKIIEVKGGERLLTQGENSSSMQVLISGRLLAVKRNSDGSDTRLGEIGPGSSVGEVGLVLQQPRTADVYAIRDSSVADLNRDAFEQLLKAHPVELNRAITQKIFEYSPLSPKRPPSTGATAFAIVPLDDAQDVANFCQQLAQALQTQGSVYHFGPQEGEKLFRNATTKLALNQYIAKLEQEYDTLLYEPSQNNTAWSNLAIRQADKVFFVVGPDTNPDHVKLQDTLFNAPGFDLVQKSLVILHPESTVKPSVDITWHDKLRLHRLYPVRSNNIQDIERLARFMTDNAVGLVLGGGGARGFAHVGVLQALAERNIAVDMICGNSMGALIAGQYVNGTPVSDLVETTRNFTKGGERPTIPIHSIFSGNRVRRDIIKMFDSALVECQWLQFFTVSCNLTCATIHVHDSGTMWEAVLASNSPAAIAPPVIHNGEFLVDAALLDNVPVDAMRKKLGFGTVIAVDVDVKDELRVPKSLKKVNPWKMLWQRIFNRKEAPIPSLFDILNRSGHLGGLIHRDASIAKTDLYLQPPVSSFSLMAYARGEQIAQVGYRDAIQKITQWQDSLNSKKAVRNNS